jgi:hypothetical protein
VEVTWAFTHTHGQEWSDCKSLRFGPPRAGTPWRYLLISRNGHCWLKICLELAHEEFHAFEECLYWEQALWIGFGYRVVRLGLELDLRELVAAGE